MSDELDFAVVYRYQRSRRPIFTGTEEAVYRWLSEPMQIDIWVVRDSSTGVYEPAEVFVERLTEKYKPKKPLTKEDVRRIVDERVGEILESLAERAENNVCGLAAYEVSDLMKPAFSAIHELLHNISSRLKPQEED